MRELNKSNWFISERAFGVIDRFSLVSSMFGVFVGLLICVISLSLLLSSGKKDIAAFLALFSGGFALMQITTQLTDRRRIANTEYVDRLVYKWHDFVSDLCTEETSILNISKNQFSSLNKYDPVRVRVVNQFLRALDLITLIQSETKNYKWRNPDALLSAWQDTFYHVLFSNPVAVSLWREYMNTVEDSGLLSARKYIQKIVDYSNDIR